jgi:16S rRNA (cytosine1402-N4)-methyltransferase
VTGPRGGRGAAAPGTEAGGGAPHVPVLIGAILHHCAPICGTWIDGTLGAGGYALALLEAGAERVIGIDRDPAALALVAARAAGLGGRLRLVAGTFGRLDDLAGESVDGVVLDLGVSSMQLDQPERGFSFLRDGPLDMRMGQSGPSAADLVATASEAELADILFHLGEERASRRIARAIVASRAEAPIATTARLAAIVASCLPRPAPGQSHPATRSFQALRIAVNAELSELVSGLEAAERVLRPGGRLAVVSFHSIEDRIVKRFLQLRAGGRGAANRHAPELAPEAPRFRLIQRGGVDPDAVEIAANPRARSARLRLAERLDTPAGPVDRAALGLPATVLAGVAG